jgi:hypothetical protein
MNIERILLIAIIIYLIISYKKNKNIEKFALSDTDKTEVLNLIRPVVKEIYNTDMEAVRQLATMATKLNAGGLEIPGNLTVTGTIKSTGNIQSNSEIKSLNTEKASLNTVNSNISLSSSIGSANASISTLDGKIKEFDNEYVWGKKYVWGTLHIK